MSQNDAYKEFRASFLKKIEEMTTKVNTIEINTIFKQTARNNLILIRDFFNLLDNSNLKNTNESVRRFIVICRSLFVDVMSSFEYETRNFILIHQDSELNNLKQQLEENPTKGITSLINKLHEVEYLDNDNKEKVVGLFAIRNMIVHHHSLISSQKDMVPDEIQEMFADFTIGKRIYGKPKMFVDLIEILVDFYLTWYEGKSTLEHIFDQEQLANH